MMYTAAFVCMFFFDQFGYFGKTLSKLLDERCHYTEEVSDSLTS